MTPMSIVRIKSRVGYWHLTGGRVKFEIPLKSTTAAIANSGLYVVRAFRLAGGYAIGTRPAVTVRVPSAGSGFEAINLGAQQEDREVARMLDAPHFRIPIAHSPVPCKSMLSKHLGAR
jgi:hypothetical protein